MEKRQYTIREILSKYDINQPITDKRILSYFKRIGYIWDYSEFGYLESVRIYPSDDWDKTKYLFENKNAKELEQYPQSIYVENNKIYRQSQSRTDLTNKEICKKFGLCDRFNFENYQFSIKYIDGCFKPYLVVIYKKVFK